jgi:Fic family protein
MVTFPSSPRQPDRHPAGTLSGGRFAVQARPDGDVVLDPDTPRSDGGAWPAVTYEDREWNPRSQYAMPAGERRRSLGPYRAALVEPIADLHDVPLSPEARALASEASSEIARFDAEVGSDIAPFASILLRSESAASSQIENLTAPSTAIALAELGDRDRDNASVIVANTTAMRAAIDLADRLDADAILKMHEALLGPTHPGWAGQWRAEQVWIGGGSYSPHDASFIPPHHERVPAAIDDLVRFLDRDDLPPLVQAATAHAQFETIHPFPDGNGRTGRALVHSALRGKGLTRKVTVPVSAGLLSDTRAYFDSLTDYRNGDPEPIVRMMSQASFAAVNNGRQLVAELHVVRDGWNDRITARSDAAAWKVADRLLSQPVIDSPMIQRVMGVSSPASLTAINHLVEVGVLTKVSGKHRDRKFAATEILQSLDAFAARAGRRGGF